MSALLPEPWLRGIDESLDPVIGHLLRASQQVREDMTRVLSSLDAVQLWRRDRNVTPAGFHAKHLAGSTDRLCTYLAGGALSEDQLVRMRAEGEGGESAAQLLELINESLDRYETLLRGVRPDQFGAIREVGRQRLRVTAIGLAIHIAEHAQRHTGQAITAAQCAA
jgi:hypothetical protein